MAAWLPVFLAAALAADYPDAPRGQQVDDYFGTKVSDAYRWLEDLDSPATAAWVAAERAHTEAVLRTIPERAALRERLRQLWNFPKFGLPLKRQGLMFYTKNEGLQNQAALYVVPRAGGAPRVLIDPNLLAADGTVALAKFAPSDDGALVVYGLATAGSDWVDVRVREVASGRDRPDVIRWVKFSELAWTHDGRGFFYGRYPESHQGDKLFGRLEGRQIYYHRLGTDQAADPLIFELKDHPDWFFDVEVTEGGRYLFITVSRNESINDALYYADLGDPAAPRIQAPVRPLLDKFDARYTLVGSDGPVFYVQTTLAAPHGKVVAIDTTQVAAPWRTPVSEGPDSLGDVRLIGGQLVVTTLHDVQSRLTVYAPDGSSHHDLKLPGIGALEGLSGTARDPEFFYGFSSFLTPPAAYSCDVDTSATAVFQRPATSFHAEAYETRQVFCTSRDGARIPLFITGKKGLKLDGSTPAWLYGYGGFNISILPEYAAARAVWLEMGGLYAQVNLRGGGEYGEEWHLAGTKERKQNVFDDFIAAADFLVHQGYTGRDRLVVEGRSNGGLLVGAVLNQRPDLGAVGLATVGVMDMLRYHTFTIGAAWASDYGTSEDPAGFAYLRAYSPVHNVKAGVRYPAVLVMTGDHDDRVYPAHSYKYAAALQHEAAQVPGSGPILIRIEHNAGHGGASGTSPASKTIDEWADKLGFVYQHLPPSTLVVPAGAP